LFEVSDPQRAEVSPLVLLGSVHFGNADMYPLSPLVEDAFEAADGLAVELDPQLSPEDATALDERRQLPEGMEVCATVDQETCRQLSATLVRLGIDPAAVTHWKPWAVAIFVQQRQLEQLGLPAADGVEMYLLRRAAGHKHVQSLETLDRHFAALDDLPATTQNALLADTVRDPSTIARQTEILLRAWCTGDVSTLEGALILTDATLRNEILVKRNSQIATALAALMKSPDRWIAVIGAAHLVGPDNIPDALRGQGYRVRRLTTTAGATTSADAMSRP